MDNTKSKPEKSLLDFNIKSLKLFGLWPADGENSRLYRVSYYVSRCWWASGLFFYPWMLYSVFFVHHTKSNLKVFTDTMFSVITHSAAMLKSGVMFFKFKDVQGIVRTTEDVRKPCDDAEVNEIIAKYKHSAHRFYLVTMIVNFGGGFAYCIKPLVESSLLGDGDHTRHLPVDGWSPVDIQLTPNYESSYVFQICLIFGNSVYNVITDALYMSILINAVGQYKILQYCLKNIKKIALANVTSKKNLKSNVEDDSYHGISKFTKDDKYLDEALFIKNKNDMKALDKPMDRELWNCQDVIFESSNKNWRPLLNVSMNQKSMICQDDKLVGTNQDEKCLEKSTLSDKVMQQSWLKQEEPLDGNCVETSQFIEQDVKDHELETEMKHVLVKCVNLHRKLCCHLKEFQRVFGFIFLYYGCMASVDFCIIAIEIQMASHVNLVFFWLNLLLCALITLYVPCWCASTLIQERANVCTAVYDSDWYDSSKRWKKMLITMMTQTSRGLKLTALGLYPLTLDVLIDMLRGAYSIYTLVSKLNK